MDVTYPRSIWVTQTGNDVGEGDKELSEQRRELDLGRVGGG